MLLPAADLEAGPDRQHARYEQVAHEYDDVFPAHVAEHYLDKRAGLVKAVLPLGGSVLDVGCGTGRLGAWIAGEGYRVYGVDLSTAMLRKALDRGLRGVWAAVAWALPFADDSFDLALTVATLHHLETPERVARTVREMGRVVRPGGLVVLWDHNPANPYWPLLMRRVPQDTGEERLVPRSELLAAVQAAGLRPARVLRSGFTPDFLPRRALPAWSLVERAVETVPLLDTLAAHNVVVAQKS